MSTARVACMDASITCGQALHRYRLQWRAQQLHDALAVNAKIQTCLDNVVEASRRLEDNIRGVRLNTLNALDFKRLPALALKDCVVVGVVFFDRQLWAPATAHKATTPPRHSSPCLYSIGLRLLRVAGKFLLEALQELRVMASEFMGFTEM